MFPPPVEISGLKPLTSARADKNLYSQGLGAVPNRAADSGSETLVLYTSNGKAKVCIFKPVKAVD